MKRLKPMDASWLLMESESTPMHVGGLIIFEKPKAAPATYLRDLVERFRNDHSVVAPWNQKLGQGRLSAIAPYWVKDQDIDLDYHFRHSALPEPGGERELGVLVSRLHSHPLDLRRPPWEMHLIEGLENNRFALYSKIHHSLIDGVSGMRLMLRWLSTDPKSRGIRPLWTQGAADKKTPRRERPKAAAAKSSLRNDARDLVSSMGQLFGAAISDREDLAVPYRGPHSLLSGAMNAQRRFATQQLDLQRIKQLAKTAGGTINDIVLYLSGSVLRNYMRETECLPSESLTAVVPINLREEGDGSVGETQIGSLIVSLGTNIADPKQRLEAIMASSSAAKQHQRSLPKHARLPYTLLTAAPSLVAQVARLDALVPPMFSLGISNVPGPTETLYFEGARMQALYPISLLMRGGALNITCVSYDGTLNFGFTGARDTLPHLQRMAVDLGGALEGLEQALG